MYMVKTKGFHLYFRKEKSHLQHIKKEKKEKRIGTWSINCLLYVFSTIRTVPQRSGFLLRTKYLAKLLNKEFSLQTFNEDVISYNNLSNKRVI